MQVELIDKEVKKQGIEFDSCMDHEQGLLYFKDGQLTATVKATVVIMNGVQQIKLDIFNTKNKLRDKND